MLHANKMLAACVGRVGLTKGSYRLATAHDFRGIFTRKTDTVMKWVGFARKLHIMTPRPACGAKVAAMLCVSSFNAAGQKAWEFADAMLGYAKNPTEHPATVLMDSLVRMAGKASRRGGMSNTSTACAYTVKALRAFINEDRIRALSWKLEEDFPTLA